MCPQVLDATRVNGMKVIKRVALSLLVLLLLLVAGFVFMVGPWPLYTDSHYQESRYFKKALAAIDTAAEKIPSGRNVGPLKAGWAEREITPKPGLIFPHRGLVIERNDQ